MTIFKRKPESTVDIYPDNQPGFDRSALVNQIEADIDEFVPRNYRRDALPLPSYIVPQGDTPEAGRLSAHALAIEYEKAAKDIEHLGTELTATAKRCEEAMAYIKDTIAHIDQTALFYRDEAKKVHGLIENYSMLAEDTRRTSELMRQRLTAGEPMPRDETGGTGDA